MKTKFKFFGIVIVLLFSSNLSTAQSTTFPQLVPPIQETSPTYLSVNILTFGFPISLSLETFYENSTIIRVGGFGYPLSDDEDFYDQVSADRDNSAIAIYFTYGWYSGDVANGGELSFGGVSYVFPNDDPQDVTMGLVSNIGLHFSGGSEDQLKFQVSFSPIYANKVFYPRVGFGIGWKLKQNR